MFKTNTICVITGASRGLGRGIAETFAKEISRHENATSTVVLMARSEEGLQETKKLMCSLCPSKNLTVHCVVGDLSDMSTLENLVTSTLNLVNASDYSSAVLINNAATIGNVSKTTIQQNDLTYIRKYWDINLTSFLYLTSCFVNNFKPCCKVSVVNISSLAAIQPTTTMSLYSAGKAARNMLFRVLALEHPDVRTLNYAPGILNTEMAHEVMKTTADEGTREWVATIFKEGKTVDIGETSAKLLTLLMEDIYENGTLIDFNDK